MNDNCPISTSHIPKCEPMWLFLSLGMLLRKSLFKDKGMEENLHSIQSNTKNQSTHFGFYQEEDFALWKEVIAKSFCIANGKG